MHADFDKASRFAYKTLLALHIDQLPINPLQILSFCNNTVVHTYSEVMCMFGKTSRSSFKLDCMEGKDAVTIRHESDGKVIYELLYDNGAHRLRQRFTLAHELGHVVMRHWLEEPFEEAEADYFASQLLIPRPILELFDNVTPEFIADTFHVSKAAAAIAVKPPRHNRNDELYTLLQRQFTDVLRRAG